VKVRLYHPAYERKLDRPTRIAFTTALLGRRKVATADVDPELVDDLLERGYLRWPIAPEAQAKIDSGSRAAESLSTGLEADRSTGETGEAAEAPERGAPPADEASPEVEADPPPAGPSPEELGRLTVAQIRKLASERGIALPASGTKAVLIAKVIEAE
jgi:pyruvate/2-oxoglutarate dehydrogenase complex dihydrolipoamide acyltransferase (E2) component